MTTLSLSSIVTDKIPTSAATDTLSHLIFLSNIRDSSNPSTSQYNHLLVAVRNTSPVQQTLSPGVQVIFWSNVHLKIHDSQYSYWRVRLTSIVVNFGELVYQNLVSESVYVGCEVLYGRSSWWYWRQDFRRYTACNILFQRSLCSQVSQAQTYCFQLYQVERRLNR